MSRMWNNRYACPLATPVATPRAPIATGSVSGKE
jgi:hypothetical protein